MKATGPSVPDLDARFDEHYLYFYGVFQTPEQNQQVVGLIAQLLEITPGMAVLDVPCGNGRIANLLALRGCQVTGLDASPLFLDRARQEATTLAAKVDYVEGDMRHLPWVESFDRVVNWFASFGYFDDDTDRQVLAGFRRALRPGGRLLLNHLNLLNYARRAPGGSAAMDSIFSQRGDDLLMMRRRYNLITGRDEYERLVVRDGRVSRHPFSVRYFTFVELKDWLMQAGFARVDGYGADGGALTLESGFMNVVAHA